MWIFTRYGFFSVAASKKDMMVRARALKHLEGLKKRFPVLKDYPVVYLPERDYQFRIVVPKQVWVEVLAKIASEQTWSNVKDEVRKFTGDPIYMKAMHEVWELMFQAGFDWEKES
jgi:hypothetical protein